LTSLHIEEKGRSRYMSLPFLMGWVSNLHRAATTCCLCCDQALEDLQGAGRIGLTRFATAKL